MKRYRKLDGRSLGVALTRVLRSVQYPVHTSAVTVLIRAERSCILCAPVCDTLCVLCRNTLEGAAIVFDAANHTCLVAAVMLYIIWSVFNA